jgi:diguanylate cyclase (GGDEF)-like protein
MVKVLLIGAGKGGQAVLSRLLQFDWVTVVGVHDVDPNAPGLILARQAKLPIFINEPLEQLPTGDVDLVFDLTGNPSVQARLTALPSRSFDLVTGQVSQLLWNVIQTLEEREIQVREYLREHQVLAEINIMLSRSQTPEQIFDAIVTGGTRITEMPSGSLSIVNHEKNELFLVAAKGFSSGFYRDHAVYPVRSGGLTEHILRQTEPVVVPNIADYPAFQNPVLIKEGIRSLIALPLLSDRGPVGILYVDDFRPRTFSPSILGMLKPLATQAVLAIQKQQAFEQIRTLSIRDPLTNLYNRRYLNEIVVGELDRAVRLRQPLSVIVIDIDHFKLINDRWGHVVGDQVLRGMAQVLSRYVRAYDTVTRFGGEEFVILMAQTGEDEALALAERIRLETAHERLLPEEYVVTCSFGINTLIPDAPLAPTPDEFIHRADQALYDAKHAGRNCVRVFGSVCP